ncbi:MAG TPA: MFS transporter, partial [Spongiibacteraceae bacterium]|nr:MFS transporter [Spongiibacteraceae bacterium]
IGLYVSGTAFGGMIGRVATGALTEIVSWRGALATIGVVDLIMAFVFLMLLPPSRNFTTRKGLSARVHLAAWYEHLRTPYLPALFLVGFLALGGFMAVYNYVGFRLSAPPYDLNHAQIGLIFFAYLGGVAASSLAGALADHVGRGPVLLVGALIFLVGLLLTLMHTLPMIIAGIVVVTIGFFVVHSIASGWVGKLATRDKGHASSLYLLAYYAGASLLGSAGGWVWRTGGWDAIVGYCAGLLGIVFLIALMLFHASAKTPKVAA